MHLFVPRPPEQPLGTGKFDPTQAKMNGKKVQKVRRGDKRTKNKKEAQEMDMR